MTIAGLRGQMSYEQRDENTFRKHDIFLNKMLSIKSDAVFRLQFPAKKTFSSVGKLYFGTLWSVISFITAFDNDLVKGRNISSSF
jgi:hypothetical protein